MFREDRERAPVVGEVTDPEAIVGYERLQRGREIVEEGPRLKLRVQRARDGLETDKDIGFRRLRPGLWRGGIHARAPAGILRDKPGAYDAGTVEGGAHSSGWRRVIWNPG